MLAVTAAVALIIALGASGVASAAGVSLTVPCTGSGGGPAGLAAAVDSADAGGGGTITLTSGCDYDFTAPYANNGSEDLADWYGPAALPAISSAITIVGNGATISRSTASGTPPFRLFFVGANASATGTPNWTTPGSGVLVLENMTLSGGLAQGGSATAGGGAALGAGGAIYNQGVVFLTGVTLSGNQAHGGSATGSGTGAGGAGMGADAPTTGAGGGFGSGFTAPAGAPTGGGGGLVGGGGGGGAGFATSENGNGALLLTGAAGGGPFTGTGGDSAGKGGDGSGGGSNGSLLSLGSGGSGGAFGQGGQTGASGGEGGGGVGGGGAGTGTGGTGAGGGFGGGGGYPGGQGGFGAGGAGGSGLAGFGAGAGGATAVGGGGSGLGGAIFNHQGVVVAENATMSGNTATGGAGASPGQGLGGAMFSLNGAVVLINDTIAANTADDAGALYLVGYDANSNTTAGVAVLENNILSGSVTSASASTHDLVVAQPGTVSDGAGNQAIAAGVASGPNIITSRSATGTFTGTPSTANPLLGPLASNGGPGMFTMLPLAGSPALGAGSSTGAPSTDERGVARPASGPIDLGAVQVSTASTTPSAPAPLVATGAATSVSGSKATVNAAINPEGQATSYDFEYGTSANYGAKTSVGKLPAGTAGVIVSAHLSKLKPGTIYHYRIVATNPSGTSAGLDATFKTTSQSLAGLPVRVTPHHARRFPYRFKFSGKLRLPRGVTRAAGCSGGTVSVRIKRGKKTVFLGHASVGRGCGWAVSARLGTRKAVPGHGKLSVTVSFGGNSLFLPLTDKAFTVLYG